MKKIWDLKKNVVQNLIIKIWDLIILIKKCGRPRQNSIIAGDPPRPASTSP